MFTYIHFFNFIYTIKILYRNENILSLRFIIFLSSYDEKAYAYDHKALRVGLLASDFIMIFILF